MAGPTTLADALLLMHDASRSFTTVRMSVRRWHHTERLHRAWEREEELGTASLYALPGTGGPEPPERIQRSRVWWRPPDHARVEHDPDADGPRIVVAAGALWWSWHPDFGGFSNEGMAGVGRSDEQEGPCRELLQPELHPAALELELLGSGLHAGRRAIALRGRPRRVEGVLAMMSSLPGGADAHRLMVDRERGVVLRAASEIDGHRFWVVEVEEIAFDEEFPPETFTLRLPVGETFTTPEYAPATEVVPLDEAARRAPFTLLAPARIPRGAAIEVAHHPASRRPPSPERVSIEYHVEHGGFSVSLSQTGMDDALAFDLVEPGEAVQRDGRALRVRDMEGEREVETEHLGTHVVITSHTMPLDALVEMMLSLEPAPTEPPELV
jgi:hypothetical protein